MTVHLCARARGSGRPLQREHGHWGWGEPLQQWIREQGTLPLVNEMLMGKRPAVLYALLLLRFVVSWNPHSLLGVESRGPSASGPHQGKPLSWIQRCSQIGLVLVWMSCGAGSANSGTQPACGLLPFNCRSKKLRTNKQQTNKQNPHSSKVASIILKDRGARWALSTYSWGVAGKLCSTPKAQR